MATTETNIIAKDFIRSEYGELLIPNNSTSPEARELMNNARGLICMAAAKGKIPAEFDSMKWKKINSRIGSKKVGDALHHEIYDIAQNGKSVLVCCRSVEATRYGIKTINKEYFIVRKHGTGTSVEPAKKATAAKVAKASGNKLGLALNALTSKKLK